MRSLHQAGFFLIMCSYSITENTPSMKQYISTFLQFSFIYFTFHIISPQLFAQVEMDSLSNIFYPDGLNDVWGYADESGNEYALVGVKSGVSIVDVTDATQPVELFFIEGFHSTWRDLKTFEHYAYVVNEARGGLQIIDLQNLPASIDTISYIADSTLNTAHNLYIDERGTAYISGYNNYKRDIPTAERSIKILDLSSNPWQPVFVKDFVNKYSHDVYVRNNMLLSSEVYEGQLMIADVSDLQNPIVLATQQTPTNFTHNAWFSDDMQVVFTTDEKNDAFVASYDVSDLSDIRELDRYQSSPGENTMPHNVHVHNDFLVISYYNDGVVVIDAHEPDALVETEFYDTSPHSGPGSRGCWGAYPFLPSGNILATDREQGLFIIRPTYQRAAYIEGTVTDENGNQVEDVEITIEGKEGLERTDLSGHYKTGVATAGEYVVRFYKYGYEPLTMENVALETAEITLLNVQMQSRPSFDLSIEVVDKDTGEAIEGAQVEVIIPEITYNQLSNGSGEVNIAPFYTDTYFILAYKWGWRTFARSIEIDEANNALRLELQKMYHDDFWLNFGWSVDVIGDMTGVWKRDIPKGTFLEGGEACNPDTDLQFDFGNYCFATGSSGGEPEDNDVDGGTTILTSPIIDLSTYNYPVLSFYQWFCSSALTDNAADFVKFELKTQTDTVELQTIFTNYAQQHEWHEKSFNVLDFIEKTDSMQLIVTAKASTADVVFEAAIDAFRVIDTEPTDIEDTSISENDFLQIFPNPFNGQTKIKLNFNKFVNSKQNRLEIFDSMGRLVWQQNFDSQKGDTTELEWGEGVEAGLYIVRFGEEMRKVVKF